MHFSQSLSVLYPEFFLQELRTRLNALHASPEPSVTNQVPLAARCAHETLTLRKGLKSAPSVKKKCIMQVHKPTGTKQNLEGLSMCSHWLFQIWVCLHPAVTVSSWYLKGKLMTSHNMQRAHRYITSHNQTLLVPSVLTWRDGDLYEQEGERSSEG